MKPKAFHDNIWKRAQQALIELVAIALLGVGMLAMLYILVGVHA